MPWLAGRKNWSVTPDVEARLEQRLHEQLQSPPAPVTASDHRIEDERQSLASRHESAPAKRIISLETLIEEFENDDGRKYLKKQTRRNFTTAFKVLREVIGHDRNVRHITRDDFKAVRRVLVHLPPHATHPRYNPKYAGWSLADVAEDVLERIASGEPVEVLKQNVVAKYLRSIGTLFNFAQIEGHVDANLAQRLAPKRQPGEEEEGRRPFSRDQLRRMFPAGWHPADDVDWMLILGLLHGARGCELAQLFVDDIDEVDGIPVMHIRRLDAGLDEVSREELIKNGSSRRIVALHYLAIELGLPDLVNRRRAAGEKTLFNTKPCCGYYYESIRDEISDRLEQLGVRTKRTTYHSLRHNFRDACRDARLPEEETKLLGGWSTGTGAYQKYGLVPWWACSRIVSTE